ncbi:hypothetical protein [Lacipirellula limnantheis]|uniref:hypothetical protein n=1 Tax=Lacipirellula limnantheis TaxID=2528024 RepID=UPI00119FB53D|nr:hypothetical protein [Lacipirellula limnantheis]
MQEFGAKHCVPGDAPPIGFDSPFERHRSVGKQFSGGSQSVGGIEADPLDLLLLNHNCPAGY